MGARIPAFQGTQQVPLRFFECPASGASAMRGVPQTARQVGLVLPAGRITWGAAHTPPSNPRLGHNRREIYGHAREQQPPSLGV